ncbi:hypothetical protein I7I53_07869 [Histoplasma capsulatum var. duboisii H88]|uniref:Uncharacterized protein n=1 Tax=Ajellomyces capsulatus (strain H88) TaxID=544711 RepID=A0A8A1LEL0_AJEC8|nr:hypothetical protein I7I53_07869 [Histoplasma capsulatum var. duboisii H88]
MIHDGMPLPSTPRPTDVTEHACTAPITSSSLLTASIHVLGQVLYGWHSGAQEMDVALRVY